MRTKEQKSLDHEMNELAKLFRRLKNKILTIHMEMERIEQEGKARPFASLEEALVKIDMAEFLETLSRFWKYLHPTIFDQMLLEGLKRESERSRTLNP